MGTSLPTPSGSWARVGQPGIALRVPVVFPEWQAYFAVGFDYSRDLSTVVYARPAGQADLYFLGAKN